MLKTSNARKIGSSICITFWSFSINAIMNGALVDGNDLLDPEQPFLLEDHHNRVYKLKPFFLLKWIKIGQHCLLKIGPSFPARCCSDSIRLVCFRASVANIMLCVCKYPEKQLTWTRMSANSRSMRMVFGYNSSLLTCFTSGALLPIMKLSKQFTKGSNCETSLCDASPCDSQHVAAAFNSFTFFRSSAVCAAPNAEVLMVEYFISFHIASINHLHQPIPWTLKSNVQILMIDNDCGS